MVIAVFKGTSRRARDSTYQTYELADYLLASDNRVRKLVSALFENAH